MRNEDGEDYHSEIYLKNYIKWFQERLIPNLLPHSVVATENAPYYNVQLNLTPTLASQKAAINQWLIDKNIQLSANMLKPEMYKIIECYIKEHDIYKFEFFVTK